MKKYAICIALIFYTALLFGCSRTETLSSTSHPSSTFSPIPKTPTQLDTQTPTKEPTATKFKPQMRGTPLPIVLEVIDVDSAPAVELLARWAFVESPSSGIEFSPDGNLLQIGRRDQESLLWNAIDGSFVEEILGLYPVNSYLVDTGPWYAQSKDGRFIAKITGDGNLRIQAPEAPSASLYYYLDGGVAVTFYPDDNYLVLAFEDGRISFVPTDSWKTRLITLEEDHIYFDDYLESSLEINVGTPVVDIAFSPDGAYLFIVDESNSIAVWDVGGAYILSEIPHENQLTKYEMNPNNTLMATGSRDNIIRLWDIHSGKLLANLKGHKKWISDLTFSPDGRLLASLEHDEKVVHIWGILPDGNLLNMASTATKIALNTAKPEQPFLSLPTVTPTPTSKLPSYVSHLPNPWPIAAPNDMQIKEMKQCKIEETAEERYSYELEFWQLESVLSPQTPCDWAVLAFAYWNALDSNETVPEEGKRAFVEAFRQNPAFAFSYPLFYIYFDSLHLASNPPFTEQPIKSVIIDYTWAGIGEPSRLSYQIEIHQAHLLADELSISVQSEPAEMGNELNDDIDPNLIQAIAPALIDFVPINSPVNLEYCTDNYSEWEIRLVFLDETELVLNNFGSNMISMGGPYQTQINEQYYMQTSNALTEVLWNLFEAMALRLGEPWASTCYGYDISELAFP